MWRGPRDYERLVTLRAILELGGTAMWPKGYGTEAEKPRRGYYYGICIYMMVPGPVFTGVSTGV